MSVVDINLRWIKNRPTNHSPRGQKFSLPVRFDHQGDDWTANAWSLVIEVEGVPDITGYQRGTARFLVPSGPQEWLRPGKKFTIFEGATPLAIGEVE